MTADRIKHLGTVSTEGGPLLLADLEDLRLWGGTDTNDYSRANEVLDRQAVPPGAVLSLGANTALLWDMPTGTADVFRRSVCEIVIVRAWTSDEDKVTYVASLPSEKAVVIGKLNVRSGFIGIVWATENGSDIVKGSPADGQAIGFAVEQSGMIAAMPAGLYTLYHDEPDLSLARGRRCWLTSTT